MFFGITLIILGLLAAPGLFLAKNPKANEYLSKLVPYQGWAGVVFTIWGIFNLIGCLTSLSLLGLGVIGIIFWVFYLVCSLTMIGLGLILGYGLIYEYALSKNETAKAKGDALMAKLLPLKNTVGLAGIVVGILYIVLSILYAVMVVAA